jgi:hypothetical protein
METNKLSDLSLTQLSKNELTNIFGGDVDGLMHGDGLTNFNSVANGVAWAAHQTADFIRGVWSQL